jgi:iron complex transport system substrate-binding protein
MSYHPPPEGSPQKAPSKENRRDRVISLLPAATEIVASLGMLDALLGVSHECDYPEEVNRKPRVTHCEIHGGGLPSVEADRWVRETLRAAGTLYTMDEDLIRQLRPDTILTQRLCDVCAVNYGSVARFAATLAGPPRVVSLEPSSLADVLRDIRTVGEVLGVPERAEAVVASLVGRIEAVRERTASAPRHRCVLLEWIDPPFSAGHWGPELVEIAGGVEPIGRSGADSVAVRWDVVVEAAPEVLVLACCGYSVERTVADLPILRSYPGFEGLPAAQRGEVYVVDGSAYFSRPGPRITDSLEILAEILHPERFRGRFPDRGVVRVG